MCNGILPGVPSLSRVVVVRGSTPRGRKTKARIVAAASRLFIEQGYIDTTMAAIASEANVAVQTLYVSFGSKVAILKAAHDVAVVGDDEPIPLLERTWVHEVRAERDGPQALQLVIENTLPVVERVNPIYGVIKAASADAEVAELLAETKRQRLVTFQALAEQLATKAGFAAELSADRAADVLYAVASDELHRLLVVERRWSSEEWRQWTYQSAAMLLFPDWAHRGTRSKRRPTKRSRPTAP